MNKTFCIVSAFLVICASAYGEVLDRSGGFKIGERLTLRPHVSASLTYDSNVRGYHSGKAGDNGDFMWTVSPSLSLSYDAEKWSLLLSGYYNYHQYFKKENRREDRHNFGEDLRWNWANSSGRAKGWSLVLGQSYQKITMADDMVLDNGQNYGGDSQQLQLSGAIQYRLNDFVHADLNGSYYWLDYDNNNKDTYSFYGWDRWLVGAEIGFAPSPWTDIILSGAYNGFSQDNAGNNIDNRGTCISDKSQGFTFQAGLGSYMTDRISYRLLAGWSHFDYGDGALTDNGFVYTASLNWKIGQTWNMMFLGTSYYQPSERQMASVSRVDALSWGLAKVMVRGKLRCTLDLRYRRETQDCAIYGDDGMDADYILNIVTGRIGLSYSLNRFLSCYLNGEYQKSLNDESTRRGGAYDYDRWRVTAGLTLAY